MLTTGSSAGGSPTVQAYAGATIGVVIKFMAILNMLQSIFPVNDINAAEQAKSTTAGAGSGHEIGHSSTLEEHSIDNSYVSEQFPLFQADRIVTKAGKIFNATKLFDHYKTGNAKEEAKAGKGKSKERWMELAKENGCAISMSFCLNSAGYIIPEHKTNRGRLTTTGNIKRDNNNQTPYEYILSATEMGGYLKEKLGEPTLYLKRLTSDNLDEFIKKLAEYKNFKAIIYLKAGDPSEYGAATGHVDLLYEDWGGDAALEGVSEELDDYLEYRDGGWVLNTDPQLEIYIWILEYEK